MENAAIRLEKLQKALTALSDVCSSGGPVRAFPESFRNGFRNFGIGLIVCTQGEFGFSLASEVHTAVAGETVFIPEGTLFRIIRQSADMEISILIYKVQPIKDILGNQVYSVHLYSRMSPDLPCVWKTGDEEDMITYMALISSDTPSDNDLFAISERKLLLLSLTYRLCAVFQRKYLSGQTANIRQTEIFLRLIQFIDRYYTSQRGVEFYADKLCLSPKYLSSVSKAVCGYTVQELVFKAIVRRSMSLLDSTNKTVLEISEELNFPNPSSFGTFFRKQTGLSPQKYRERKK
ncbi:helix-turn-helix domain-containing protein [Phocaeicola barnesiae]|uniref:helix-turn-helix domain-containing protein n=1 Tax=Phocaeicola barnesiae TaxID=376804 RepID=UPI0025A3237E|nr:helix-turn-helix domain-containing protein [Phocaeicola barnesiae]MDM8308043.1 helix-turn-helix domain-containing protein [Phocaeicola barnesiae]